MPKYFILILSMFAVTALCVGNLRGDLAWQTSEVSVRLNPGESYRIVSFPFRNTGHSAVALMVLATNCSCITAKTNKTLFAPGASGQIEVAVDARGQTGHITREVTVITDEPDRSHVQLMVHLTVPEVATLQPRLLVWSDQERGKAKEVFLRLVRTTGAQLKKVESDWPPLHIEISEVKTGELYRIRLTPPSDPAPRNINVTVEVQVANHIVRLPVSAMLR